MASDRSMMDEAPKRLARKLPAGMIDASLASLATFSIGLAATNLLDNRELGVYAVFFSAFMFGTVLPRNLVFTPAEVTAVSRRLSERMNLLAQSVKIGLVPAIIGALGVGLAAAVTWPLSDAHSVLALTVTTGITTVISPIQDHIRKLFHIADHSWLAASVSTVQVIGAGGAVVALALSGVASAWIPFGALAIANTLSLGVAVLLAARVGATGGRPRLRLRSLTASGKWLVLQASAPSVAGFVVAAIVVWLAGPEALGYAEAARVVAQPVLVLATGLTAVLAPRAMEASMRVDLTSVRRVRRIYLSLVIAAGVGYLIVAGVPWIWNPMQYLVSAAYVVPGLVALTILTNTFTAGEFLQVNELLGAKREKSLMVVSFTTSPILILVASSAALTGAFARPLGGLFEAWTRLGAQGWLLRKHYSEGEPGFAIED